MHSSHSYRPAWVQPYADAIAAMPLRPQKKNITSLSGVNSDHKRLEQ